MWICGATPTASALSRPLSGSSFARTSTKRSTGCPVLACNRSVVKYSASRDVENVCRSSVGLSVPLLSPRGIVYIGNTSFRFRVRVLERAKGGRPLARPHWLCAYPPDEASRQHRHIEQGRPQPLPASL